MKEYTKYLEEKIMYALGPKNKEFAEETKNGFRKILKKGFELKADTYTIQQNFYDYYKNMK